MLPGLARPVTYLDGSEDRTLGTLKQSLVNVLVFIIFLFYLYLFQSAFVFSFKLVSGHEPKVTILEVY